MKKLTYRIVESTGSTTYFYLQLRKKFLWLFPYWSDYCPFDGYTYPLMEFKTKNQAETFAKNILEANLNATETIV